MRDRQIKRAIDVLVEESPDCSDCPYRRREEFKELATHIVDAIEGEHDRIAKNLLRLRFSGRRDLKAKLRRK